MTFSKNRRAPPRTIIEHYLNLEKCSSLIKVSVSVYERTCRHEVKKLTLHAEGDMSHEIFFLLIEGLSNFIG